MTNPEPITDPTAIAALMRDLETPTVPKSRYMHIPEMIRELPAHVLPFAIDDAITIATFVRMLTAHGFSIVNWRNQLVITPTPEKFR